MNAQQRYKVDATLNNGRIKILDGSFGYQLDTHIERSLDGDPLWTAKALLTNPEAVVNVHIDYIRAGSDIIETNSYQASINGFKKYLNLTEEESYNLIKKSVLLAKTAIERCEKEGWLKDNRKPLIAGSIGPYGAFLHDGSEYSGGYTNCTTEEQMRKFHRPRILALIEGGVDLLAIETIPSRKEAELLVELIKDFPNIRAWLSFSCLTDGISTANGDNFAESAISCYNKNRSQIIAVGTNCISPNAVGPLLEKINLNRTDPIPLIAYANSGENYDPSSGWDNHCDRLEPYIPNWLDIGVKYVGGCCRVCANYISKIKDEVDKWEVSENRK